MGNPTRRFPLNQPRRFSCRFVCSCDDILFRHEALRKGTHVSFKMMRRASLVLPFVTERTGMSGKEVLTLALD